MSVLGPVCMYIDVGIFLITFKSTEWYSKSFVWAYYHWRNTAFYIPFFNFVPAVTLMRRLREI